MKVGGAETWSGEIIEESLQLRFTCTSLVLFRKSRIEVERVKGIEPLSQAWEAHILPLNHTRVLRLGFTNNSLLCWQSRIFKSPKRCAVMHEAVPHIIGEVGVSARCI